MRPNLHSRDRDIRLMIALLLLLVSLFTPVGFWQLLSLLFGVTLFLTAATGFCPLCRAFGFSTASQRQTLGD